MEQRSDSAWRVQHSSGRIQRSSTPAEFVTDATRQNFKRDSMRLFLFSFYLSCSTVLKIQINTNYKYDYYSVSRSESALSSARLAGTRIERESRQSTSKMPDGSVNERCIARVHCDRATSNANGMRSVNSTSTTRSLPRPGTAHSLHCD